MSLFEDFLKYSKKHSQVVIIILMGIIVGGSIVGGMLIQNLKLMLEDKSNMLTEKSQIEEQRLNLKEQLHKLVEEKYQNKIDDLTSENIELRLMYEEHVLMYNLIEPFYNEIESIFHICHEFKSAIPIYLYRLQSIRDRTEMISEHSEIKTITEQELNNFSYEISQMLLLIELHINELDSILPDYIAILRAREIIGDIGFKDAGKGGGGGGGHGPGYIDTLKMAESKRTKLITPLIKFFTDNKFSNVSFYVIIWIVLISIIIIFTIKVLIHVWK